MSGGTRWVKKKVGKCVLMAQTQRYCCLVLVIAHRDAAYTPFRDLWWTHWCATAAHDPRMALFFLYNDPAQKEAVCQNGPDLTFAYAETYPAPGLLLKTMGALQWFFDRGIRFEWCLRTNLSSGFDWRALRAFLDGQRCRSAVMGMFYAPRPGPSDPLAPATQFVSGAAMLLSEDVARDLLQDRDRLDFNSPDDHAINLWLHAHRPGVPSAGGPVGLHGGWRRRLKPCPASLCATTT